MPDQQILHFSDNQVNQHHKRNGGEYRRSKQKNKQVFHDSLLYSAWVL